MSFIGCACFLLGLGFGVLVGRVYERREAARGKASGSAS
jgi:hypothetical protein